MANELFEVSGTVDRYYSQDSAPEVKTERQAAAAFKSQGGIPQYVNGAAIVGFCEASGAAIFEDDKYESYADGPMVLTEANPEHDKDATIE